MKEIIEPTMRGMDESGYPFSGVFFAGLMITAKGPELIEYNVRFGDPECQVLMMRLKSDLLPLLLSCANGTLDKVSTEWSDDAALSVVLASKGYPGTYEKNTPIALLPADAERAKVFHAGTAMRDGQLVATGGRVLNVTATGASVGEAQKRAYALVDQVRWDNGFCRRDIGWQAIAREKA
jgi:phosphoribosylamine--glycine ligase